MNTVTDTAKSLLSLSVRRRIKEKTRILTSKLRLMPDFIIIGAQRCGTTSLYNYLTKHPCIGAANKKEIHFFDSHYKNGPLWYRAHFPTLLYKNYLRRNGRDFVTGEASPYYIFHPHTPYRISQIIPDVKLIVLLRNPVDRAYSHYHHEVRKGFETLSLEDALEKEEERLGGEVEKMRRDENYYSFSHQHHSYLSRGIYVDQVRVWKSLFPKEHLLILKAEDLYTKPSYVLGEVLEFLHLPTWSMGEYREYNEGQYVQMTASMRRRLLEYFRPYNLKLYEELGTCYDWDP